MDSDVGKLFIGGISWETSEEKLKSYFEAYGDVIEAVIMKDRATGRARGFGFVVFSDPLVADRVVQEKHTIDGRQVEAKKAVPRDEQQNGGARNMAVGVSSGPNSVARTKKIFVGGLAATVSEHDFRKYFDQFGSIADVVVMYDHATQRPRGFGFITYDSEDGVERVLQKSFHELKGKMVEVKRAIPKEMSPSPIRSNGGGPSFAYGHFNPSPIGPFASRMDSRYSPSPGTGFSPYGAVGYGSNSSRNSFISAMNAGYNSGSYGGANTPFGRNFGPGPSSSIGFRAGGYGAGSGGYGVSGSTPGRNLWSTGPMTYGSNNLVSGYGYNRGSSIDTYSGGGLGSWPSGQNPNSNGGYGNSNVSYGSTDGASYGSNNVGYNGRGNGYGSSSGIYSSLGSPNSGGGDGTYESNYNREMYNSFGYRERSQKTLIGTDPFSPSAIGGSGFRGYGLSDNGNEFVSGAYTTSPFVAARQSQRGTSSN